MLPNGWFLGRCEGVCGFSSLPRDAAKHCPGGFTLLGAPALCRPLQPLCVSRPLLLVHVLCALQGSGWQVLVEVFIPSLESDWSPSDKLASGLPTLDA